MNTKFCVVLLLVFLAILFIASLTQAADPREVDEVIRLMKNPATRNIIERKTYAEGGIRIVFVVKKKESRDMMCYTFYYTGNGEHPWLSVWVRPDGSVGKNQVASFSDIELDGNVDFGIGNKGEKKFGSGEGIIVDAVGENFRSYWQGLYDQAIADALRRLK